MCCPSTCLIPHTALQPPAPICFLCEPVPSTWMAAISAGKKLAQAWQMVDTHFLLLQFWLKTTQKIIGLENHLCMAHHTKA